MDKIKLNKLEINWLRPVIVARWSEIIAVILIFCGHPLYTSIQLASRGGFRQYTDLFLSNSSLLVNLAYASGELALMLSFLHCRGWVAADLKIKLGCRSSLHGIFLMIFAFIASTTIAFIIIRAIHIYSFDARTAMGHSPNTHNIAPSWTVLITFNIVDVFYEEIVYIGYAFNQCASKQGSCFALLLTILIRVFCHSYQGLIHMIGLGAVFLIFEIYYLFSRNLWPVILAHVCLNMVALSYFKLVNDGIRN